MPIEYTDKVQNAVNPLPVTEQFRAVDANEIKNVVNAIEDLVGDGYWEKTGTTSLTGNVIINGVAYNVNFNFKHLEVSATQHINLDAPILDFTTVVATNGYQIAAANGLGLSVIKVTAGVPVAGILISDAGVVTILSPSDIDLQGTTIKINGAALSKSNVGLSNVDNTSDATKRTARVQSVVSSATVTPNADADDMVKVTAQAAALFFANPTGTPTEGQMILLRVKDNATARAITYDTNYREIGVVAPTTTVISKTTYIALVYNSTDTKWDIVGSRTQA